MHNDSETSNNQNWYRDYVPPRGHYVQKDPIGLRGGLNLYSYTGNNPIKRTDSLGLDWYYSQGTGRLVYFNSQTQVYADFGEVGTSGNGDARDDSSKQNLMRKGPIVSGTYTIEDMVEEYYSKESNVTLYDVLPLTPDAETNKKIFALGRTGGFLMHKLRGKGTNGCIGMADNTRKTIADIIKQTGDRTLHVEEVLIEDIFAIMNLQQGPVR